MKKSCLKSTFPQTNPGILEFGLADILDHYSMKQKEKEKEKQIRVDLKTDAETSLNGHIRLEKSDEDSILLRCNLCGMEFYSDDTLIQQRISRHQERHNPVGKPASSNIIRGNVKWLEISFNKIKRGVTA